MAILTHSCWWICHPYSWFLLTPCVVSTSSWNMTSAKVTRVFFRFHFYKVGWTNFLCFMFFFFPSFPFLAPNLLDHGLEYHRQFLVYIEGPRLQILSNSSKYFLPFHFFPPSSASCSRRCRGKLLNFCHNCTNNLLVFIIRHMCRSFGKMAVLLFLLSVCWGCPIQWVVLPILV